MEEQTESARKLTFRIPGVEFEAEQVDRETVEIIANSTVANATPMIVGRAVAAVQEARFRDPHFFGSRG